MFSTHEKLFWGNKNHFFERIFMGLFLYESLRITFMHIMHVLTLWSPLHSTFHSWLCLLDCWPPWRRLHGVLGFTNRVHNLEWAFYGLRRDPLHPTTPEKHFHRPNYTVSVARELTRDLKSCFTPFVCPVILETGFWSHSCQFQSTNNYLGLIAEEMRTYRREAARLDSFVCVFR